MIRLLSINIYLCFLLLLIIQNTLLSQNLSPGIKDFIGLETIYQDDIEQEIEAIENNFKINNSNIIIRLEKVYPISTYLKETDGMNAMINSSKQQISSYDSSFIIFYLMHKSSSNEVSVQYHYRIANANLNSDCNVSVRPTTYCQEAFYLS